MQVTLTELIRRNQGEPKKTDIGYLTPREVALRSLDEHELPTNCFEPLCMAPIPRDSKQVDWYRYLKETYGGAPEDYLKPNKTFDNNIQSITGQRFREFEQLDKSDAWKVGTLCYRLSRLVPHGLRQLTKEHAWIEDSTFFTQPTKEQIKKKIAYLRELKADLFFMISKTHPNKAYILRNQYHLMSELDSRLTLNAVHDKSAYLKLQNELSKSEEKENESDALSCALLKHAEINRAQSSYAQRYELISAASKDFCDESGGLTPEKLQLAAEALWKLKVENMILSRKFYTNLYDYLLEVHRICLHKEIFVERFKKIIQVAKTTKEQIVARVHGESNPPKEVVPRLLDFAEDNRDTPASYIEFISFLCSGELRPNHRLFQLNRQRLPDIHMDYWDLRYRFYEIKMVGEYSINNRMWELECGKEGKGNHQKVLSFFRKCNISTLHEYFFKNR